MKRTEVCSVSDDGWGSRLGLFKTDDRTTKQSGRKFVDPGMGFVKNTIYKVKYSGLVNSDTYSLWKSTRKGKDTRYPVARMICVESTRSMTQPDAGQETNCRSRSSYVLGQNRQEQSHSPAWHVHSQRPSLAGTYSSRTFESREQRLSFQESGEANLIVALVVPPGAISVHDGSPQSRAISSSGTLNFHGGETYPHTDSHRRCVWCYVRCNPGTGNGPTDYKHVLNPGTPMSVRLLLRSTNSGHASLTFPKNISGVRYSWAWKILSGKARAHPEIPGIGGTYGESLPPTEPTTTASKSSFHHSTGTSPSEYGISSTWRSVNVHF